ncbi:MAG: superoxide dismutase family protein [Gemmatimonadota bacterium]
MGRVLVVLGLALVALLSLAPAIGAEGERASGTLIDGTGKTIGAVQLEQRGGGVTVNVTVQGADVVKPGEHGIHLHAVGKCDGPDFTTAGGHFNPTGKKHGARNPEGPHAGDLPNLVAGTQGATYQAMATGVTLAAGPTSLFDADGTALVIHANPDDQVTDPAGNSGGRVACAVLALTAPGMPNTGAGGAATQAVAWSGVILLGALSLAMAALVATTRVARRRA